MATYKVGKVKVSATGLMTGTGTNWTAANALVRVGATVVLATNPVRIYTVGSIISATSIQLSDWGSDAAITTDTGYSILLHDGLTVQGLAQDTAETLRYYRNFEQTLGGAAKMEAGEQPGQLMKVGAFGLGGKGKSVPTAPANANELMKSLRDFGCTWWRAQSVTDPVEGVQIHGHGAGFFSYCGDTMAAINSDYSSGKLVVLTSNDNAINSGNQPKRNVVFGTALLPEINTETRGVLSVANGGTGANSVEAAQKSLGVWGLQIQAPDSGSFSGRRSIKILSMKDPGSAGGRISLMASNGFGVGEKQGNFDFVTISARNINDSFNAGANLGETNITHKRTVGSNHYISFSVVPATDGWFDVYVEANAFVNNLTFTVISRSGGNNVFKGAIDDGKFTSTNNGGWIETPANAMKNTSDVILDTSSSRGITAVFAGLTIAGDTEKYINVNHAQFRGSPKNGNVIISGNNGADANASPSIYLRPLGSNESSKEFRLQNDGNARATGSWISGSDVRIKKDFSMVPNALEAVVSMRGVTYIKKASGMKEVGLIAQDVQKHCPDAVYVDEITVSEDEKYEDGLYLNTAGVAAAYSVEAIKEVVKLMDLMLDDPEAARARIKALKAVINDQLPE